MSGDCFGDFYYCSAWSRLAWWLITYRLVVLMQTMSFGLQCSSQNANGSFHSAVLEHSNNAAKLGTVNLLLVFKRSKTFFFVMQFFVKVGGPSILSSIKDVQSSLD